MNTQTPKPDHQNSHTQIPKLDYKEPIPQVKPVPPNTNDIDNSELAKFLFEDLEREFEHADEVKTKKANYDPHNQWK